MKRILGGISPNSGYHTRVKPLESIDNARDKLPTYGHQVGKKPINGYLIENSLFYGSSCLKNEINPEDSLLFVSTSFKNEVDLMSILLTFQVR